ncbi:hypothetical protein CO2235_U850022 [Cupriavidus oxalaticus]|uniref:Uncharacterized protein n=1 Tax=Cupriavidus oxalaticus TaxID=96344 RepID=A0A375FVD6_9BURK|nr:hypothetical protein CO2235_U850022 [Cupriavidus oxalaticus]
MRMANLVMKSAQDILLRSRMVVLHEHILQTGRLLKVLGIETLEKKSPVVPKYSRLKNQNIRDGCRDNG